jgi:hypothetical protein
MDKGWTRSSRSGAEGALRCLVHSALGIVIRLEGSGDEWVVLAEVR